VKGWEGGELWINSATMTARVGFGIRLANYGLIYPQLSTQVAAYAKQFNVSVPVAWVRVLSNTLGPLALAAGETNALVNYAQTVPPHATAAQTAAYYSNLVPLIMGTAEFQVC